MSAAEDIAVYISDNTALTLSTDLFIGRLPEQPDSATRVADTAGIPPQAHMGSGASPISRPRVQIMTRDYSWATGRATIQTIHDLLDAVSDEVMSGTRYLRLASLQDPFYMGPDDFDRERFVVNVDVWKER